MLEQAITELQNIERSVVRKTLSDLQIRLALRSCLKELRSLSVAVSLLSWHHLGPLGPGRASPQFHGRGRHFGLSSSANFWGINTLTKQYQ